MWYEGHTFESRLFTFTILDRVGGGRRLCQRAHLRDAARDHALSQSMLNFAVASSVLKHTIHGDANLIDDAGGIRNLMNMNYDIKR